MQRTAIEVGGGLARPAPVATDAAAAAAEPSPLPDLGLLIDLAMYGPAGLQPPDWAMRLHAARKAVAGEPAPETNLGGGGGDDNGSDGGRAPGIPGALDSGSSSGGGGSEGVPKHLKEAWYEVTQQLRSSIKTDSSVDWRSNESFCECDGFYDPSVALTPSSSQP